MPSNHNVTTSRSEHFKAVNEATRPNHGGDWDSVWSTANRSVDYKYGTKIPKYLSNTDYADPYYAGVDKGDGQIDFNIIDIATYGTWCLNPAKSRTDLVVMELVEYQPRFSPTLNRLVRSISQIAQIVDGVGGKLKEITHGVVDNPVAYMYNATFTGFIYRFPMLALMNQDYNTSWGSGKLDGGSGKSNLNGMGAMVIGAPTTKHTKGSLFKSSLMKAGAGNLASPEGMAAAWDPIQIQDGYYSGSSSVSWTYTIELSNTVSWDTALYNKELVELLAHNAGMANLRNSKMGDSPCIYTLEVEGVRWCPACHLDISYEGGGVLQFIDGHAIPESYVLTINVNEIIPPLRLIENLYKNKKTRIMCISTEDPKEIIDRVAKKFDASWTKFTTNAFN